MPKYYSTTISKLYKFLVNIGYKNIYQINEFLLRGYMPCTDPSVIIANDDPYLYVMKLNTITNTVRCNIYYFVGSELYDIEDIEDMIESFMDEECEEVKLKKKNNSDKLYIDTYTNRSKYIDNIDSSYFANWVIKFI
jgi:hypothetical protein